MALLAVIAVTAAVSISVTSGNGGDDDPAPSGETFGLKSADDTGPVNIITEDPSCAAWGPINDTLADTTKKGWNKRDPAVPARQWTEGQRIQFEEVGRAAGDAAEQAVAVARLTPHRVTRELYEQFIASARAYSEAVPAYEPSDDHYAGVFTNAAATLTYACTAISTGAAEARAHLASQPLKPTSVSPLVDPADPRFLMDFPDPTCPEWSRLMDELAQNTKAWQALDPAIAASDRTPEQRAVIDGVIPQMMKFASGIEKLGMDTANPALQDLAILVAQYRRAYAQALPTYASRDSFLSSVSARAAALVYQACKAAGV